jgi:uncharacterized protein YjhX (UPF0386 family)
MIRYKGIAYDTLTERVLPTGQRSLLCKMSSGSKVYDGYSKRGLWLSTAMEVSVNRNTLNSLVRKGLVKRKAGHVYEITMKGREWANAPWNPVARRVA